MKYLIYQQPLRSPVGSLTFDQLHKEREYLRVKTSEYRRSKQSAIEAYRRDYREMCAYKRKGMSRSAWWRFVSDSRAVKKSHAAVLRFKHAALRYYEKRSEQVEQRIAELEHCASKASGGAEHLSDSREMEAADTH